MRRTVLLKGAVYGEPIIFFWELHASEFEDQAKPREDDQRGGFPPLFLFSSISARVAMWPRRLPS